MLSDFIKTNKLDPSYSNALIYQGHFQESFNKQKAIMLERSDEINKLIKSLMSSTEMPKEQVLKLLFASTRIYDMTSVKTKKCESECTYLLSRIEKYDNDYSKAEDNSEIHKKIFNNLNDTYEEFTQITMKLIDDYMKLNGYLDVIEKCLVHKSYEAEFITVQEALDIMDGSNREHEANDVPLLGSRENYIEEMDKIDKKIKEKKKKQKTKNCIIF